MQIELSYDDLTPAARTVIELAGQHAARRAAASVAPEHLLLALLDVKGNLALKTLAALHVDVANVRRLLTAALPPEQPVDAGSPPPMSPEGQAAIRAAFREAPHLGHYRVDAFHLLMGLLYENEGLAYTILNQAGVSLYELRHQLLAQPKRFKTRHRDELRSVVRPSPIFLLLLAIMAASGFGLWHGIPDPWVGPLTTVFVLSGWIASVCIHEFGHAITAFLGGDRSVRDAGYLTLNPLRYTEPVFSIILPIIYLLAGGMGLPGGAVYIRTDALRSRRWEVLVAAAGPLGTLCFCLLLSWPFFFDWPAWITEQNFYFWPALAHLALLQVMALIFNLIPIPPLDGFRIIAPSLPIELQQRAYMASNMLFMMLMLLMWQDTALSEGFWRAVYTAGDMLQIPLVLAYEGGSQFAWWRAMP